MFFEGYLKYWKGKEHLSHWALGNLSQHSTQTSRVSVTFWGVHLSPVDDIRQIIITCSLRPYWSLCTSKIRQSSDKKLYGQKVFEKINLNSWTKYFMFFLFIFFQSTLILTASRKHQEFKSCFLAIFFKDFKMLTVSSYTIM